MESDINNVINISDEMRQSYLDYAMSVIIGRALPDVRDGLKPVQKRVLYAMYKVGLLSNKKTSKCAGVVGEVLKKYHPHGDSAVYDALVNLAQPWGKRMPLIEGQGNFGSIDGDPPAAYRYTECRLSKAGEALLQDIEQNTVDFQDNFDDTTQEPIVLPSVWPNILVNGADGIAVGMATHIPPHNLGEVCDAIQAIIKDPELKSNDLMQYIPGPDFPTGGIIQGTGAIKSAYNTGKGIVRICARTEFETIKRKNRDVNAIIVTEVPYQVNKKRLIEKIAELVNAKKIDGISNVRDESDRVGMRIVIELKASATQEVVLNQLFKLTPLRSSFGIINLAIVAGRPQICTLKELIVNFLDHRRSVIARRTQYQLNNAEKRLHILEGFLIALANLDDVIELIKKSETPAEAKEKLIAKYELSDVQSQAILDLRLQKLTGLERLAIENEHKELLALVEELKSILSSPQKIDQIISGELEDAKKDFSTPRRTLIEEARDDDFEVEDLIEEEDMAVTVSHRGYVKRTDLSNFKAQKRGGKGVSGSANAEDDFIEHFFVASTHDYLMAFTDQGRVYWLKVYQVPEAGRTAKGRALVNLLNLNQEENITAVLTVKEFSDDQFLTMVTDTGVIKRVNLSAFSKPRKGGIQACGLKEDEQLIEVRISNEKDDLLLSAASGKSIRFSSEDVRVMGRTARGVRGIQLAKDDRVVGMRVLSPEDEESKTLLTVCENGYGKRTKLSEYRQQGRGGKGLIDIQTEDRNGPVIGIAIVDDNSEVMLISSAGKVIRMTTDGISTVGRNTKGVRLLNLDDGEQVKALAFLPESDDSEDSDDSDA